MARLVFDSDACGSTVDTWRVTHTAAAACAGPDELGASLVWHDAVAPGTVASSLRDAGLWNTATPTPLHDRDHWYRTRIEGHGPRVLRFAGLAGIAQVWLGGVEILRSDNMFVAHQVDVSLDGGADLVMCFRSLDRALQGGRRGRWRPRLVRNPAIRLFRQTLLGHMPGWCPDIDVVGPWREVTLLTRRMPLVDCATWLVNGACHVAVRVSGIEAAPGSLHVAGHDIVLQPAPGGLSGEGIVPDAALWWPHTHGVPALHEAHIQIGERRLGLPPLGFRSVAIDRAADGDGFGIVWNGVPVFCRGAVWTPPDLASLPQAGAALLPALTLARDGGMNMLRLPGTGTYEADAFHGLCDQLGILVWQDFMFAALDYPAADAGFRAQVAEEAAQLLSRTQTNPSLAVLCGGSEVAQQAAMLGLERGYWSNAVFDAVLPEAAARLRPDVPFVAHSPGFGDLPFLPSAGISHYYGVGAYLRPLDDARLSRVRFASECLALANLPDAPATEALLGQSGLTGPGWKAGIPRDGGASWDFEDVRDHYLQVLSGVDARRLRTEDAVRYLDLSRAVSCELAEAVFGQWRLPHSGCAGGLVLQMHDLRAGAGWGVVDVDGGEKPVWHALRRAFAPQRVVLADEGLNGLDLHVLNDGPDALAATLSLASLRDGATPVAQAAREIVVPPHDALLLSAAALLGRFFDATYAYRFGPLAHSVTVAELTDGDGRLLSQAIHVPGATRLLPREDIGMTVAVRPTNDGWRLTIAVRRFAQYVRVRHSGCRADDQWFHVSPLRPRDIQLSRAGATLAPDGEVLALNAHTTINYRLAA